MAPSLVQGSTLAAIPFGSIGKPFGPFGCVARIVFGFKAAGPFARVKTLSVVGRVTNVASERIHLSQQERGKAESAAIWALCGGRIKRQLPCAVHIARHAQILGVAEIGADLQGMISEIVCDIADPLK